MRRAWVSDTPLEASRKAVEGGKGVLSVRTAQGTPNALHGP